MTAESWVIIIVAVLGCITGGIRLVKSFLVDRRVRLESYFRNVWLEVWPRLNSNMQEISNWLDALDALQSSGAGECFPRCPSKRTLMQIDGCDWAYDKRLYKLLKSYESRIQQLNAVVGEYNKLLYPTTSKFAEWVVLGRVGGPFVDKKSDHEKAEEVLSIARKYIDPEKENVEDLKKNKDYQQDLSKLRAQIRESIAELRHIVKDIQKRADFHCQRFC